LFLYVQLERKVNIVMMTVSDTAGKIERHVVLVAPEIHWNTGNIGRTCLAVGAELHLIEPLGFSLDSREVKRAGLDYWPEVVLHRWQSFEAFERQMQIGENEVILLTKNGSSVFWSMPSPRRLFMIFGSETQGLPGSIIDRYRAATFHIPTRAAIRSLNLSTAVGIVLYESLRKDRPAHAWPPVSRPKI
jgi:tRNA (cytidine/uridine-2'-O-)-methyltransferase